MSSRASSPSTSSFRGDPSGGATFEPLLTTSTTSSSASFSPTTSSRFSIRSLRFLFVGLLIATLLALLLIDLEIFDDIVLGYRRPTPLNLDYENDGTIGRRISRGNGNRGKVSKKDSPAVPRRWGSLLECCPLRLGTMFQKGESTLYDYFTGNQVDITDMDANDNFFCELSLEVLKTNDDIIMDMNVDHIIRDIYLKNESSNSVITKYSGVLDEPIDFILQNPYTSNLTAHKEIRIIDIFNVLQAEEHKCSQNIVEYLNNESIPMILLHGSAYTADNCGDGGIVSMAKIADMLESSNVLMYISSVSVLLQGASKEIDSRLASNPKTLILPSGLHNIINSASVFRYLQNICDNRWKKINLLQNPEAKVSPPVHEYLVSNFESSYESSNNPNSDYFRMLSESKFVICTDSWKIDESLLVGAIPIVETSVGLNYVYSNLPVLFLDSFQFITPELLEDAYTCFTLYANKFNYNQLNTKYWVDLISRVTQGNSSELPSLFPDNPYCNYKDGLSHKWNETVIGHVIMRGDRQLNLDIRDKLNIFRVPKEKYEVYRRHRHRYRQRRRNLRITRSTNKHT